MPRTIRWKLLIAILPLVAIGIIGIVWLQYRHARDYVLADINKDIHGLAERAAGNIDDLLRQRYNDLFTLAETSLIVDYYRNVDFRLFDEARAYRGELEKYLLRFFKRSRVYSRIVYWDEAGRPVGVIEGDLIAGRLQAPPPSYFETVKKLSPGAWWVSPVESRADGTVMVYAKPIHDDAGRFKGVLALDYDLAQVGEILSSIRVGKTGHALIRMPGGPFPPRAAPPSGGEDILVAGSRSKELPWLVEVAAPLGDFVGPLKKIRDAATFAAIIGIGCLIGVILLLVRSITRPVAALADAARRIGQGDLSHRIGKVGDDELGLLSGSFNEMAQNLESNRKANGQLQAQLVQAEKLSAVGQLISSVAHELNNPLAAVCGYIQLALLEGVPASLREDLESVRHNALRCRKVVENLLFFVRKSRREKSRVDLNRVVASALELLQYRLIKTEDVAVARELSPDMGDIVGDFQQIVQVLVNLINNACDAMEEVVRYPAGKKIILRTWMEAGRACLSIEDNGSGVPASARDKLFEPFFTSKEPGRGTGLGLSICRQIIEDHGGSISFATVEGKGTTFSLSLPAAVEDELLELDSPVEAPDFPAAPGRRILVVDDEKDIADIVARLFSDDGDQVEVATQGLEALRLIRENSYDLVISDFEMEKAKGEDIFTQLTADGRPAKTRILFITGDTLNPKVTTFLSKTKSEYLTKPFDLNDLRQAGRRLLSESAKA